MVENPKLPDDGGEIDNSNDRHIDTRIERYFTQNLFKLVGYIGYLALGLGTLFFFQARSEHEDIRLRIAEMKQTIDVRTGETTTIETYLQIIENDLTKQLSRAAATDDTRRESEIKEMLDRIRQLKLKDKKK